MDGKDWRIEVGQPTDLLPGLVTILVLQVAGEVLKDEAIHFCDPVLRRRGSLIEWRHITAS